MFRKFFIFTQRAMMMNRHLHVFVQQDTENKTNKKIKPYKIRFTFWYKKKKSDTHIAFHVFSYVCELRNNNNNNERYKSEYTCMKRQAKQQQTKKKKIRSTSTSLYLFKQTILKSFSNLSCWHLLQNFKQIKIYQVPIFIIIAFVCRMCVFVRKHV